METAMDENNNTGKSFKVWNCDKSEGRLIAAQKLAELKAKVESKFELNDTSFHIVLVDGCKVDEDDAFHLLPSSTDLYILQEGQNLCFPSTSSAEFSSPSVPKANLLQLVQQLRKRKTSLNMQKPQTKKVKTTAKINLGWLHFDDEKNRYCQVKLKTGGGSRVIELPLESQYEEIMERAKELFFPAGVSRKGKVENFSLVLADFRQTYITKEGFSLMEYIKNNCLTTKPRIYLMTKRKEDGLPFSLNDIVTLSSDDDGELPDLVGTQTPDDGEHPELVRTPTPDDAELPELVRTPTPDDAELPDHVGTPTLDDGELPNLESSTSALPTGEEEVTGSSALVSPVIVNLPKVPLCTICTDRYSDSFLDCGHILCFVCAMELSERGSMCHICRKEFEKISHLYYQ